MGVVLSIYELLLSSVVLNRYDKNFICQLDQGCFSGYDSVLMPIGVSYFFVTM